MNWLDVLIIITLAVSVLGGLFTGVVRGVVNLVGLIIGIMLAGKFYTNAASLFGFIHNTPLANVLGFALILILVMVLATILGNLLHKLVSLVMLGWLDHLIGGILGLITGAITWGAILALWAKFFSADAVSGSALAKILLQNFPLVLALLPSDFDSVKNFFK